MPGGLKPNRTGLKPGRAGLKPARGCPGGVYPCPTNQTENNELFSHDFLVTIPTTPPTIAGCGTACNDLAGQYIFHAFQPSGGGLPFGYYYFFTAEEMPSCFDNQGGIRQIPYLRLFPGCINIDGIMQLGANFGFPSVQIIYERRFVGARGFPVIGAMDGKESVSLSMCEFSGTTAGYEML